MDQLVFYSLAGLTLISALVVVLARNPMYSVLSLIFCFFTIAGHYILLHAQFLAITHIIVYAGAIMVLFLFVVMLLNLNVSSITHKSNSLKLAGAATAGMLLVTLLAAFKSVPKGDIMFPQDTGIGLVKNIGTKLFTEFLVPFEISSILFLSAMIGAVLLAKKDKA